MMLSPKASATNPLPYLASLAAAALLPAAAEPSLTIYNQGFAVVRDSVPLDLKAGITEAHFSGMTAQAETDSVILRDPAGKVKFQILEQAYRNDPVSSGLMLQLNEGKTIGFEIREPNKPNRSVQGKIIRSGYVPGGAPVEPIVEMDGKLQFSLPGQPVFPSLGEENILKPALAWQINAPAAAKINAEVAYVTQGFSWQASYNLVAPEKGDLVEIVGWITIQNDSGSGFQNAKIKLMAGDVNKVQSPHSPMAKRGFPMIAEMAMDAPPVVSEKAFDEFHLYTLANRVTLRDKETKQVEFIRATGVKADRLYIYDGAVLSGWRVGMSVGADAGYGTTSHKKVNVYREFKNSEANQLGIPLPKGRVRFYSQDDDRQLEFVGENNIEHTPKGELVRVFIGDSFDLVGDRKRSNFKIDDPNHVLEDPPY